MSATQLCLPASAPARPSACPLPSVLAGAPRTVTDKLQRVLNAAAHVITGTRKFDRGLGQILHDQLHWLDVPVSERPRTSVSVGALHRGLQC